MIPDMIRHIALWTALAMLAGCGQKGPLYLPPAKSQVSQSAAGGTVAADGKTSAAKAASKDQ